MTARNTLFYGDNLRVLREHVPSESVDLVYLDPPFNSNRAYNVLFKEKSGDASPAQIEVFDDTWSWDRVAESTFEELIADGPPNVAEMIGALRKFVGSNDMMAYLVMMAVRLVELRRVLKPAGSLYLHCDPTASHYLKVILDAVFGARFFRNEIVWQRTSSHNDPARYGRIHDVILFYSKSESHVWNTQFELTGDRYLKSHDFERDDSGRLYRKRDLTAPSHGGSESGQYEWQGKRPPSGRMWSYTRENMERLEAEGRVVYTRTGMPRLKIFHDDLKGVPYQDVWARPDLWLNSASAERLGYPTQKPLALLGRIIASSSNPGDVVLDPFCGCGTAVVAAEKLGRRWIGIDVTHLSISLMRYRLNEAFPGIEFDVRGEPADAGGARMLAEADRYQFQWWALSLIKAKPVEGKEKKGADRGIDGVILFVDDKRRAIKRCLVQVKSGHVNSATIRDLVGTLNREQAELAILLTLEPSTAPMRQEAVQAGLYRSEGWQRDYPRVQILTIEELLKGAKADMPPVRSTFAESAKIGTTSPDQIELAGF